MKKILLLIIICIVPLTGYSQFIINTSGSYTGTFVLNGITACACKEVVINNGVAADMDGDWDLRSVSNLILRIKGSGSLIFSGSGSNRDELLMTANSILIIEDRNNTNALTSGNGGNVFIIIGTEQYKGNDFASIISAGGADNNGPLPIELKSFESQVKNSTVQLDWVTAKEENFSHFEVERSTDMQNFEMIGLVQGQGESLSDVSYDFEDSNAPFGIIYYRLKAVDIDDTFDYSPVVQVENGFNGRISVYPNPAAQNENMKIKLPSAFEGNVNYIAIYDLQGSKMQEAYNYDPNTALNINKQVKAGLYLLKIQHNGVEENIRVMIK